MPGMTALAIAIGEGDLVVTEPAVFACKQVFHRIFILADFRDKELGMTDLAAVPCRMFFVGKNYIIDDPFEFASLIVLWEQFFIFRRLHFVDRVVGVLGFIF